MSVIVRGHVRAGRLTVDEPTSLPEGTEVDLAVLVDNDEPESLDAEERARLDAALTLAKAEMERGEVFPIGHVLSEL